MEEQAVKIDSVGDLRVPLEDEVGLDAVGDIADDEVLLEEP